MFYSAWGTIENNDFSTVETFATDASSQSPPIYIEPLPSCSQILMQNDFINRSLIYDCIDKTTIDFWKNEISKISDANLNLKLLVTNKKISEDEFKKIKTVNGVVVDDNELINLKNKCIEYCDTIDKSSPRLLPFKINCRQIHQLITLFIALNTYNLNINSLGSQLYMLIITHKKQLEETIKIANQK
jgi:hypothetical protein